jgi:hypothetical protein
MEEQGVSESKIMAVLGRTQKRTKKRYTHREEVPEQARIMGDILG